MLTLLQGDALEQLQTLESKSVQCCVTSPPYWGLRDYGTGQWEGGDEECQHKPPIQNRNGRDRSGLTGSLDYVECQEPMYKDICHCGARRIDSQLGLEPTPQEYIANMVAVFREVGRALRDDGTLFLNLGDSYARNGGEQDGGNRELMHLNEKQKRMLSVKGTGLKPKDLVGIPWRVAFALQADGWYLRSDIIWHKPNPMPESVTDRPTKAHEYIFLLAKSERYFYDAEAIKEENSETSQTGGIYRNDWKNVDVKETALCRIRHGKSTSAMRVGVAIPRNGRNKRSVWTIPTQPYAEAHFATFPEEIPKLCILAGTKLGDTVLDPFAGSGTTGQVAIELGRKVILIELNPDYCEMIRVRCTTTIGMPFTRSNPLTDAESPAQPIQMLLRL
jgi:DNA modification methylase